MILFIIIIPSLIICFLIALTVAIRHLESWAQAPLIITCTPFTAEPLNIQRKYSMDMPDDFIVQDLVNYPVSSTPDDTPSPGVTYMTVFDLYYNVLPGIRLDDLNNLQRYFIARDSLTIPAPLCSTSSQPKAKKE